MLCSLFFCGPLGNMITNFLFVFKSSTSFIFLSVYFVVLFVFMPSYFLLEKKLPNLSGNWKPVDRSRFLPFLRVIAGRFFCVQCMKLAKLLRSDLSFKHALKVVALHSCCFSFSSKTRCPIKKRMTSQLARRAYL